MAAIGAAPPARHSVTRLASDRNLYHFVTRWRLPGTCEEISDVLEDTEQIPRWWPSVYREVHIVRAGGLHSLGKVVDVVTKGALPYSLRWQYEVVEQRYPNGWRLIARGDLEGEGRWEIEQTGPSVDVTYNWRVRANHPLIRKLGLIMRPLFKANHVWTMRDGERGLRKQLAQLHFALRQAQGDNRDGWSC